MKQIVPFKNISSVGLLFVIFIGLVLTGGLCDRDTDLPSPPPPHTPGAPTPDLGAPSPVKLQIDITSGDPSNVVAQQAASINVKITVLDQYNDLYSNITGSVTVTSTDRFAQINGIIINPSTGYITSMSNSEADIPYSPESVKNQDAQETITASMLLQNGVAISGSNTYKVWFCVGAQIRPAGPFDYIYQNNDFTNCANTDPGYSPCSSNNGEYFGNGEYDPVCYNTGCPFPFVGLTAAVAAGYPNYAICSKSLVVQQPSYTMIGSIPFYYNSFPNSPQKTFEMDDTVFMASPTNYFNNGNSDSSLINPPGNANGLELSDTAELQINPDYAPPEICNQSIGLVYWRFTDEFGN